LSRASVALLIGSKDQLSSLEQTRNSLLSLFPQLPVFILFQEPGSWVNAATGEKAIKPPHTHPLLVCGIARPERFLSMVRASGVTPSAELIFPDHHHYIKNDFPKSRELYSKVFIMTEKDAVRLRNSRIVPADIIWYLTVELRFNDRSGETLFYRLIDNYFSYF
ncbi:MAG: tetraacyldisaccharide 4'-kinase, partial [Chitinispirillaceae bacterium]|nr:tetraacyldisaccharide 4'-kinase [Chitinispirillaceae bacterium]